MSKLETILVVGLGNPILGDDGVGWRVVEQVEAEYIAKDRKNKGIEFEYYSLGGLSLMERMEGYRDVIVVDSILTGKNPNGTIYSLPLSSLPDYSYGHTTAIHDASLATALEVGRKMGLVLPEDVWIVAVEAEFVYDFSEELSPEVERAVPTAVKLVKELVDTNIREEKIYDIT
ncbi:MAG: hydrogenase maturation protease [Anaerolineales bacterium]|nr:hydrogenase maturation protease [Anaerolineales bacterium]